MFYAASVLWGFICDLKGKLYVYCSIRACARFEGRARTQCGRRTVHGIDGFVV